MLKKLASIFAALIVAAAFSIPAQAQVGGQTGAAGISGGHVGGARVGGGRMGAAGISGAVGSGRYHYGYRYPGYRYAYRHRGYRYGYYGGYLPYLGWGAFASAWPYYGDYGDYGYYEGYGDDSGVAYCVQRFKSYDPVSRTYRGYDGRRHSCP